MATNSRDQWQWEHSHKDSRMALIFKFFCLLPVEVSMFSGEETLYMHKTISLDLQYRNVISYSTTA